MDNSHTHYVLTGLLASMHSSKIRTNRFSDHLGGGDVQCGCVCGCPGVHLSTHTHPAQMHTGIHHPAQVHIRIHTLTQVHTAMHTCVQMHDEIQPILWTDRHL